MCKFFQIKVVFVFLSLLSGCAIHPLPEDYSQVPTYQIVQQIRCEAKQAILLYATNLSGIALNYSKLKKDADNFFRKNPPFTFDQYDGMQRERLQKLYILSSAVEDNSVANRQLRAKTFEELNAAEAKVNSFKLNIKEESSCFYTKFKKLIHHFMEKYKEIKDIHQYNESLALHKHALVCLKNFSSGRPAISFLRILPNPSCVIASAKIPGFWVKCPPENMIIVFDKQHIDDHIRKSIVSKYFNNKLPLAIGYDFKFTIEDKNELSTENSFAMPFNIGSFSLGVNGEEKKTRETDRSFKMAEDAAFLLIDDNKDLTCARDPDWKYPLVGKIGLDEVISSFYKLSSVGIFQKTSPEAASASLAAPIKENQENILAKKAEFTEKLTFTTEFSGSLAPGLTLNPVPGVFRLTKASGKVSGNRKDLHSVTITLVQGSPSGGAPVELALEVLEKARDRENATSRDIRELRERLE